MTLEQRWADLQPPLGYPGGPCYVVQRILEEVEEPKLQAELIDDIQKGKELSNPAASKVYDLETERGVGPIKQMVIGPHAQYRGVYTILNIIDGKVYVGVSSDIFGRWKVHKGTLGRGVHHNPHLQNAWKRYGEKSFQFDVLHLVQNEFSDLDLLRLEDHYCKLFNVFDRHCGYNVIGVNSFGKYPKPPEVREKLRLAQVGKKRGPMPEEQKKKISQAHKGKKQASPSEETKEKIRQIMKVQRVGSGNPAFGKPSPNRRYVRQMTMDGLVLQTGVSLKDAASACGCTSDAIAQNCKGKSKSSAGFRWEFCDV